MSGEIEWVFFEKTYTKDELAAIWNGVRALPAVTLEDDRTAQSLTGRVTIGRDKTTVAEKGGTY